MAVSLSPDDALRFESTLNSGTGVYLLINYLKDRRDPSGEPP